MDKTTETKFLVVTVRIVIIDFLHIRRVSCVICVLTAHPLHGLNIERLCREDHSERRRDL